MRCYEEYRALLTKINVQKCNYAEKEMAVSNELEQKIQLTVELKKKWGIRTIIYFASMIVLIGIIYDFLTILNEKWVIGVVFAAMVVIFFVLFGFEMFYKVRLKKLNIKKEKEQSDKVEIRSNILSLNDKISSLIVSLITINEHFYELSSIENEQKLIEKWDAYTKEVICAVNKKNFGSQTYTEYQDFLREYEKYYEVLENF